MFCSVCGSPLSKGATFCPVCKHKLYLNNNAVPKPPQPYAHENMQQAYRAQKKSMRQSETYELQNAVDHFLQKKAEFDEYDRVCDQLGRYAEGSSSALIVWGAILASIGMLFLLALLESSPAAVVFALPFVMGGAGMIVGGILKKVNHNKQYDYYRRRYAYLADSLYRHYAACPGCPVGPEYCNPDILMVLMNYLRSGRADTIKESLNLAVGRTGQGVSRYLTNTAKFTSEINARIGVPAIFVAARLFK